MQTLNDILTATAQLREQHLLHLRTLRLKDLCRAAVQAHIFRDRSEKDRMGRTRHHHNHWLYIRLPDRSAMRSEPALGHIRHQVRCLV